MSKSQKVELEKANLEEGILSLKDLFEKWKDQHENECFENYKKYYESGYIPKETFFPDGIVDENNSDVNKILFIAKESATFEKEYTEEKCKEIAENPEFWLQNVVCGTGDGTKFSSRLAMLINAYNNKNYEDVDKTPESLKNCSFMNLNKRGGYTYCNKKTLNGYVNTYSNYIKREIEIINPDIIVCCGNLVKHLLDKFVFENGNKEVVIAGPEVTVSVADKEVKVVTIYHPSCYFISDTGYLEQFRCAVEGEMWNK